VKKGTVPWKRNKRRNKKRNSPKTHERDERWRMKSFPPFALRMQASEQSQQAAAAAAAAAHCLSGYLCHSPTCIMLQPQGVSLPAPSTAKQSCQHRAHPNQQSASPPVPIPRQRRWRGPTPALEPVNWYYLH
jgi:hypothetical protein